MRFLRSKNCYVNTDYISSISWDCYNPSNEFTDFENENSWFVIRVKCDGETFKIINRPIKDILEPIKDLEFDRKLVITQLGELCLSTIREPLDRTEEDINIDANKLVEQLKQVLTNTFNVKGE